MATGFPLGGEVAIEQLEDDPHALLARLRRQEPVSWVRVLDGWLVTRHDIATEVMRDSRRFTVDDPRFSTSVVVGASMLSLDGARHEIHRAPFAGPFRPVAVRERFAVYVEAEVARLLEELRGSARAELRRSFAGPLAALTVAHALGLAEDEVGELLGWYDQIVDGVRAITAGGATSPATNRAAEALRGRLARAMSDPASLLAGVAAAGGLGDEEIVSNAAVLLFGGIETTEGMICNAVLTLLRHPDQYARVADDPKLVDRAVDESLRLDPAAAVVDRYATGETSLAGARIGAGDLVRVSITAANRDPAVFADPDRFDLDRSNPRRHIAFAQGPHVCLGIHLARLEARAALTGLLSRFPRLRLDQDRPARIRGLVFRKPSDLHVRWD